MPVSKQEPHTFIEGIEHKYCIRCNNYKFITEFHRFKTAKDGLYPYCKMCKNSENRQRRQDSLDMHRARDKEYWSIYYAANKNKHNEYSKDWYNNTDSGKQVRTRNRHLRRERQRAVEQYTSKPLSVQDWHSVLQIFNNSCAYCGSTMVMTQDHIIPLSLGGTYQLGNILSACGPCNSSKGNNSIWHWYTSQPSFNKDRAYKIVDYIQNYSK